MQIYIKKPVNFVRIGILRGQETPIYFSVIDADQDEVIEFIKKLVSSQRIPKTNKGIKTRVITREAKGSNNGKSKSISFRGISPDELYELILLKLS